MHEILQCGITGVQLSFPKNKIRKAQVGLSEPMGHRSHDFYQWCAKSARE